MKKFYYLVLLLLSITSLSLAQKTYVPDNNFEQALIDLGYDNVPDDSVLTANINKVTYLNVDNKNISDLTGIEAFTALDTLSCNFNQLTRLNITNNTKLIQLYCSDNLIENLDLSKNTALDQLYCYNNQLTSLNLSKNILLYVLHCGNNQITSLDVSKNTLLEYLWSGPNQLTGIDLSSNTLLKALGLNNNQLTDLDISNNIALATLYCNNNRLSSLDLSNNSELKTFRCDQNLFTNVDFSKNEKLISLSCCLNPQLTSLNVKNGNNTILTDFGAGGNPNLSCIQVDNAAWSTANWPSKDATASYSEDCSNSNAKIYVPDDNFEQALIDLGYDDVLDDYVLTANINIVKTLYIDRKNIRDLTGIEAFTALEMLMCYQNQLSSLDVSNNKALKHLNSSDNQITDLDLTKNTELLQLNCNNNQLTSLNLSNNILLYDLGCGNNRITELDVSKNTLLEYLWAGGNNLTNLDVSINTKLKVLAPSQNQLTSLDVSKNIALETLYCNVNRLSSLDLSNNSELKDIHCEINLFTNLDFSKNTKIRSLACHSNQQLTSLNVKNGHNTLITNYGLDAGNNPNLTCIQVDNAAWSTANWPGKDAIATYSEQCGFIIDSDGDGIADGDDDFPNDPSKAFTNYFPATGYGSLGFEDLWPGKGDYDFNDLVLDYRFKTITNSSNKVVQIIQTFIVKASGAALKNGFGFNLPDANSALVNSLDISGYDLREGYIRLNANGTESGQSKPTVIAFDNAFNLLPHAGSAVGVNTETTAPFVPYDTLTITLTPNALNYTMNDFSLETWNPFIIVNGERGKEVHLIDNPPTDLANQSYFGTWEDESNQGSGKYYRTINGSPWAINIAEPFVWPLERIEISQAYLHFLEWAVSSGTVYEDWYKDLSGYRNNEKLYLPINP